jgi:hypothetical protein
LWKRDNIWQQINLQMIKLYCKEHVRWQISTKGRLFSMENDYILYQIITSWFKKNHEGNIVEKQSIWKVETERFREKYTPCIQGDVTGFKLQVWIKACFTSQCMYPVDWIVNMQTNSEWTLLWFKYGSLPPKLMLRLGP